MHVNTVFMCEQIFHVVTCENKYTAYFIFNNINKTKNISTIHNSST